MSDERSDATYVRLLTAWVGLTVRHPLPVLLAAALVSCGAAYYATARFQLDSDTSKLVHQDAPFRRIYREFGEIFPQYEKTTLIVITSRSPDRASDAAERLAEALRASPDRYSSVFVPGGGPFYREHALLFLGVDELEEFTLRLARAQPALAALAEDPSLRGLFSQLESGIERLEEGRDLPTGFTRMVTRVSEIGEQMIEGSHTPLSWEDEFLEDDRGDSYRLVIVQGHEDFRRTISSEGLLAGVRKLAGELDLGSEGDVRIRLTGMVPLAHDEIESARDGVSLAGLISLVCLTLVMVFGVRSLRVVVTMLVTVAASIVWTAALALATVGSFNTVSLAFCVLLMGLGVDFGIHVCLRHLEAVRNGTDPRTAVVAASRSVGAAVSLCAVTSSIGFLSFLPTDYSGLAELGAITGGGMLMTLCATFTVTPALLAVFGTPKRRPPAFGFADPLVASLNRRAGTIAAVSLLIAVVSVLLSLRMTFDFSTLGMRDPNSESMTTLKELQDEGILTDYAVNAVASDLDAAQEMADRLTAIEEIEEVRAPESYVPLDQEEKLELIEDALLFMWPVLHVSHPAPSPSPAERLEAVASLRDRAAGLPSDLESVSEPATRRLAGMLGQLLEADDPEAAAADLERLLVADLDERLEWLRTVLRPVAVRFEDLPGSVRSRVVAADGRVLLSALPREDIRDVEKLRRFIDRVSKIAPDATGRPVVEAGIGEIVVRAFYQAIGIALVGIALVLFLTLRSVSDTLLVFAPLTLAAFLTIATGVVLDMPFNMSNVIVIPLVMGLGVDNGIHMLMRFRRHPSLEAVLESSTPRAIVLSGLTTLGAFGALSISSHLGIRSLGIMLTLSLVFLLASTLVVLPALLAWREGVRSAG
jgi:hopanoid biosynthesis associated RND transporter like protein HpnN